jgi:hypothetical protein
MGFGHLNFESGINTSTASGSSFMDPTLGGKLGVHVASIFYVGGYLGRFSFAQTDATFFKASGTMLGGYLEAKFLDLDPFSLAFLLGGGMSMGTRAGARVNGTDFLSSSFNAPFVLFEAVGRLKLASQFFLVPSFGYRVLSKSAVVLAPNTTLDLNLNCPFVGAGLQLSF